MQIDNFALRHIGLQVKDIEKMLEILGAESLEQLSDQTLPEAIRLQKKLNLPKPISEYEYLKLIKSIAAKNKIFRSYIGMGYYGTITPSVIIRNILENPSWYTSYTPYQAEISQGRLEALLNFQTMVIELTGMKLTNCSLLDEATAAAEAMTMMFNMRSKEKMNSDANIFFIDSSTFPQTIEVLKTRSKPLGIELLIDNYSTIEFNSKVFGALVQYPNAQGNIIDYSGFVKKVHENGSFMCVATDLMSVALLVPPGEWNADIVLGSSQRFGVPLGYGGPHAGFLSCREEYKRFIPGRIIGVTKDVHGNSALRLALQTREQHIKRERATSNICTAQALLATMAGFYAVYHGPEGIRQIAAGIHSKTGFLVKALEELGYIQSNQNYFDTLKINLPKKIKSSVIQKIAIGKEINLRSIDEKNIGISIDETVTENDIADIISIFAEAIKQETDPIIKIESKIYFNQKFLRKSPFLTQDIFLKYRSETELMRYIKKLEKRDIALNQSMISLGSCTMKLNAATLMFPISYSEFGTIHPFVPIEQSAGYQQIINELEKYLCEITGFVACSLQPNSGASGEYTGLMIIREFLISIKQGFRNIVLIPSSAHGTNPASAALTGMKILVIECDSDGNVNIDHLKKLAEENKNQLAALMITYPSTHGVFEEDIKEICQIIHQFGGQVYMDGANMNAQVGLTSPGTIGADVCHLNLHKTFAIPHGGGGPGMGPVCVAKHLTPFLPGHPVVKTGGDQAITAVSAAPWGSASILPISYGYIRMLGNEGLIKATQCAILNANYIASSLEKNGFKVLYKGKSGRIGHEMIIDCREFKTMAGITEADIAKRLMDYGFHAPTLSFPVHGTLMIEPTESESLYELNRFIDTMNEIKKEIEEIGKGEYDQTDNVLKNAPHTALIASSDNWTHKYPRHKAVFPLKWIADNKYWPPVGRVDDAYGDRNLICSCS